MSFCRVIIILIIPLVKGITSTPIPKSIDSDCLFQIFGGKNIHIFICCKVVCLILYLFTEKQIIAAVSKDDHRTSIVGLVKETDDVNTFFFADLSNFLPAFRVAHVLWKFAEVDIFYGISVLIDLIPKQV